MLDLEPATRTLAELVTGVGDDQLDAATPCGDRRLGDLLDHVDGLSQAFTAAARKQVVGGGQPPPVANAANLDPDWRSRIPQRLAELARAWQDEQAWTGLTGAGGIELDGSIAGLVALDEVLVHGWDVAVASGQRFTADPTLVRASHDFVAPSVASAPEGTPGLFGPPVPVPDDAPLLDRLIGLTGRDPGWQPPNT